VIALGAASALLTLVLASLPLVFAPVFFAQ